MDPMGYKNIIKSPFTVVTAMMLADVPDSQKIVMAMNGRWGLTWRVHDSLRRYRSRP